MRILLVDDHPLFRAGLKFLLCDLDANLEFFEASSCSEALALSQISSMDIVLLDLNLPDSNGLEGLQMMRESATKAMVVLLSSDEDPTIIRDSIGAGAAGYIPKSSTQNVLVAALQLVLAGGSYLPPSLLDGAQPSVASNSSQTSSIERNLRDHLSHRQREVLQCAVQGKANKTIARELEISEATVKAHLSASFRALGVKNRTEAVYAVAGTEMLV